MRMVFPIVFVSIFPIYGTEFMYPVANRDNILLYITQKSLNDISVCSYNLETETSDYVLSSCQPLGLQLLPDNTGFSFFDEGRIRIKYFQKRRIKNLSLARPLVNINSLHWIDSRRCFFSGKQKNRYKIFQMDMDGTLVCLKSQPHADCLYPQKIGDSLFYIERSKQKGRFTYQIMKSRYYGASNESQVVCSFEHCALMFLCMMSDGLGYVIEYPSHIPASYATIPCTCQSLEKIGSTWERARLFTFSIPVAMVQGNKHELAESILPLLPRYYQDRIDFVHYAADTLNIYRFIFHPKPHIQQCTYGTDGHHYFSPLRLTSGQTVYGGVRDNKQAYLWIHGENAHNKPGFKTIGC